MLIDFMVGASTQSSCNTFLFYISNRDIDQGNPGDKCKNIDELIIYYGCMRRNDSGIIENG